MNINPKINLGGVQTFKGDLGKVPAPPKIRLPVLEHGLSPKKKNLKTAPTVF